MFFTWQIGLNNMVVSAELSSTTLKLSENCWFEGMQTHLSYLNGGKNNRIAEGSVLLKQQKGCRNKSILSQHTDFLGLI